MYTRKLALSAIAVLLAAMLLASGQALAHSIHIFGWFTDKVLHTYSYISRDKPLRGGEVIVKTANGKVLAKGKPDENGIFDVPISTIGDEKKLTLIIDMGDGHRAEFPLER